MKVLNFRIERNQVIDVIKNLKILMNNYDNPEKKGERYFVVPVVGNKDFRINIVLDRNFKEKPKEVKQTLLQKIFMKGDKNAG